MSPRTFDRALRQMLRDAGCEFLRQGKGSHEVWRSPITGNVFPVQVGVASRHTANVILRQAGLPKAF
ncbi:type II toxin-antitoxin system HicA family toxin [Aureimonas psammosilenae]|uniref:type II toxin-antitoxin system HicA family toxin n=1 Tax=Aureimonas psammosilenae TaxID=2495496 RepID=UPI00126084A3|nr:type II toxin-antitoxin system HicA family toxin [Aureimonas psammosilenae]